MKSSARNSAGAHRAVAAGPIISGQLWPIRLLHDKLGWGARAVARAKREGLPVLAWGKFRYVRTDDLIGFLSGKRAAVGDFERLTEVGGGD
jgi:hypothetical protein